MLVWVNFLIGRHGKTLLFCLQYVILTTTTSLIMESIFSYAWQQKVLPSEFLEKYLYCLCVLNRRQIWKQTILFLLSYGQSVPQALLWGKLHLPSWVWFYLPKLIGNTQVSGRVI
ncbi:hypothetical protein OIU76_008651 [Salix suchowensis]|nr:hypothetical protein OIU76_008651 [Salix suchowensis]